MTLAECVNSFVETVNDLGIRLSAAERRIGELEVALAGVFARRAADLAEDPSGVAIVKRVEQGELDPWSAAEELTAVPGA